MPSAKQLKRRSTRSEKAVAERLGGRRTFNSGAGLDKADGRVMGKYRIENKITTRSSYTLTHTDWMMLQTAAWESCEMPIFHIQMKSALIGTTEVVVLRAGDYEELFQMQGALSDAPEDRKSWTIRACDVEDGSHPSVRLTGSMSLRMPKGSGVHVVAVLYTDFLQRIEKR